MFIIEVETGIFSKKQHVVEICDLL